MSSIIPASQRYTAIWQSPNPHEREWIEEILGPYISEHVTDGNHEVVLDNAIVLEAFVYCSDPAYYARFRGKNAFLVHFLDENYEGGYEIYRNFRGVLRGFWSGVFDPKYVMALPLGYSNGMARGGRAIGRATTRKYVWSFVGQANKSSRPDVARGLATIEPHFMYSTDNVPGLSILNHVNGKPRRFPPSEFSQFLFDSAFSPCPMGNANLECYRVYESLECGAIPILEKRLTLDYFRKLLGDHPMPTFRSWTEARHMIGKMLRNPDDIDRLQEECMQWWDSYKRAYTARVGEFLQERSGDMAAEMGPMVSKIQTIPGWQVLELTRHHNTSALLRRASRQANRLLTRGKLREAHRPGAKAG